jgi:hypothetical protein
MIMKTPICFNSKGNEVIAQCSFNVGSCLFLNNHHRYMCYRHQCLLYRIYENRINNDNVHQNTKAISGSKNIHSLLGMVKEKVGNLPLNMCSLLQSNNCNNIPKCLVRCCTLIPTRPLKQMGA